MENRATHRDRRHGCLRAIVPGWLLVGLVMGGPVAAATRTITVFERASDTLAEKVSVIIDGEVCLPMDFLVETLGMQRKSLPGNEIGICWKDVCVPLSVGTGPHHVHTVDGREFVPAESLFQALGGMVVWDADEGDLLLDLTHPPSRRASTVGSRLQLTLPDLTGKPVSLSQFLGKKVLLFAWASW